MSKAKLGVGEHTNRRLRGPARERTIRHGHRPPPIRVLRAVVRELLDLEHRGPVGQPVGSQ